MQKTAFEHYLKYEKRLSDHSLVAYSKDVEQFFDYIASFDGLKVPDVRHTHVRSWIVDLLSQGRAPRTISRKIASIKAYYRFLMQQELIEQNPAVGVSLPKIDRLLPAYLQESEVARLFHMLFENEENEYNKLRDKLLIALLYGTGLRRSELIGLRVEDIDLWAAQIKVLGKGNKERLLPLGPFLVELLDKFLALRAATFPDLIHSHLLLTEKGKPLYPKMVYNTVRQYLSGVTTLEQKSPHVLRHTFATHLTNKGANLNAVKELLGHSSLAATQIYTHNSIDQLKKVYEQAHPKAKENPDNP